MTPKEKAEELINRFIPHTRVFHEVLGWEDYIDSAKQCSIIAVNEVLADASKKISHIDRNGLSDYEYWWEVKKELDKL
jgi:non-ribosomal peptide synthetase component E (peptide arylation enzyme)